MVFCEQFVENRLDHGRVWMTLIKRCDYTCHAQSGHVHYCRCNFDRWQCRREHACTTILERPRLHVNRVLRLRAYAHVLAAESQPCLKFLRGVLGHPMHPLPAYIKDVKYTIFSFLWQPCPACSFVHAWWPERTISIKYMYQRLTSVERLMVEGIKCMIASQVALYTLLAISRHFVREQLSSSEQLAENAYHVW